MPCSRGCCETFREHVMSISISSDALPNRKAGIAGAKAQEKQASDDYWAVKQMAKEGIVPKSSVGAAQAWAQADDRLEIETGHKFHDLKAAKELAEDLATPKPMAEVKKIAKENAEFIRNNI